MSVFPENKSKTFHEVMLDGGRYRQKINACYIPSCDGDSKVAIRGLQSGEVRFYCALCASEMLQFFPNLFEAAS